MSSLTFQSIIEAGHRYQDSIMISFYKDVEPQRRVISYFHHLPCGGAISVLRSKGKLRIIII